GERIERRPGLQESSYAAPERDQCRAEVWDEVKHAGGDAPDAGLVKAERQERTPGGDAEQRVRGEDGEQVALHLRVDLLEDVHGVLLARQRRSHELYQLAPEVRPGSEQEIGEQQHDRCLRRYCGE